MDRFVEIDKKNVKDYTDNYDVICCKLRNSRIKCKQLAIWEMLLSNFDIEVLFVKNAPLGDVKGLVSFLVKKEFSTILVKRVENLGYFNEFYILDFECETSENNTELKTINPLNWKGLNFLVNKLFVQDESVYEQQSPHKREFKIVGFDGEVKTVHGYRGDGTELGRRALPVEDARCLVNLTNPYKNYNVLEPFAGGGGIVYMYKNINTNINITSIDIDPNLKPGLEFYGANHIVGDSSSINLTEKFDAIATEIPFSDNATFHVTKAFKNFSNNLNKNSIVSLMCGISQSKEIELSLQNELNFHLIFSKELNRKGTDVAIQIWTNNKALKQDLENTINIISKIY